MENKLRVLKENMKRSGNGEIAALAEYGDGERADSRSKDAQTKHSSLRNSTDSGGKHHGLGEIEHMLPKSQVPGWNSGAINTQNKKFKLNSNRSKKALGSESTSLPPIKERGRMPAKDLKVPPTSKSSDVKQRMAELKSVRLHKEAAKSGAVPTN